LAPFELRTTYRRRLETILVPRSMLQTATPLKSISTRGPYFSAPLDNRYGPAVFPSIIDWRALMAAKCGDIVQGTLEMLVLKTLALQPMHGFGISVRIAQMSDGLFHVIPGSLFPALNRLEREGRIKGEWRSTENNRRARYYALTELGRKALKEEIKTWDRQVDAVARILEA